MSLVPYVLESTSRGERTYDIYSRSREVSAALWAPTTGTVNPWQLGIAAFESAKENGCKGMLQAPVVSIALAGGLYRIETTRGEVAARAVVNCAGLGAVHVQELILSFSSISVAVINI